MKRCPECNRVETDDALIYCRVDGTALITDSGSISGDARTAKFASGSVSSEIETSILPHTSTPEINRPTVPITVLPQAQTPATTRDLSKPKRRGFVIALAVVIAIAVVGVVAIAGYFYITRSRNTPIDSIAVLPFQNTSGDPNAEYLSDGIAESLINSLTQLQQLSVVARTTAFHYKGKDVDPQQAGRDLKVRAVLSGRVQQMGDTLNIQVDLVDVTTGAQLWGEEYNRKPADVLAIKQDIAREVTDKLRLRLSGEQQKQMASRETTNPEAYQFYLKGRYYWNKRTADGLKQAIEQFQQAIDRDRNYALGYVGLADCYLLMETYSDAPASESLPKARAAADRALQIDNSLAEAHTSSANASLQLWDWAEAEEEFRRAISLNPNYPTEHHWFAIYFLDKRQFDEALRELKRAQDLDPVSPIISVNITEVYFDKNELDLAIAEVRKVIELDPSFPLAHHVLGLTYLKQRRYQEAVAESQKAVELSGRSNTSLSGLGYEYGVMGRRAEALAILKELEGKYAKRESNGSSLAAVYAGLGDKDQAFAWLEKDFQQQSGLLPDITWVDVFEDLRSDQRYADLVRRMGLKP